MSYPSIEIKITGGNLNRPEANEDNIAALVLPDGNYAIPELEPEIVFSLKQAEALGFTPANDAISGFLHYEQIKEFYRVNPNGELHLITTDGRTLEDMLGDNATAGSLEAFIIAANGRIKHLAIMADDLDSEWFNDNIRALNLVEKAQAFVDRLSSNSFFIDTVFLEGHGFNDTPGGALDLRSKDAPNVAVVIGGDYNVANGAVEYNNYAAVGTVLGSATRKLVHESFASCKSDNTITSAADDRFLKAKISSDLSQLDLYVNDDAALKVLHDKGYVFPRQVPFLSGFFWNQSNNCVLVSEDINSTELVQVINKAIRIVGAVIMPYVNGTFNVVDGRLTEIVRKTITVEIRNALEANMGNNISSIGTLLVDPTNDANNQAYPPLSSDATLRVFLGLVAKGKAEQMLFQVGYQN